MSDASVVAEYDNIWRPFAMNLRVKADLLNRRFSDWIDCSKLTMKAWAATAQIPHGHKDYIMKVYIGDIQIPALKVMQDEGRTLFQELNALKMESITLEGKMDAYVRACNSIAQSEYDHADRVTRLNRDIEIANLEADLARARARR